MTREEHAEEKKEVLSTQFTHTLYVGHHVSVLHFYQLTGSEIIFSKDNSNYRTPPFQLDFYFELLTITHSNRFQFIDGGLTKPIGAGCAGEESDTSSRIN